ncbi:putative ribonuclease H-like domain-containing protein [Tanacetum coccineum]
MSYVAELTIRLDSITHSPTSGTSLVGQLRAAYKSAIKGLVGATAGIHQLGHATDHPGGEPTLISEDLNAKCEAVMVDFDNNPAVNVLYQKIKSLSNEIKEHKASLERMLLEKNGNAPIVTKLVDGKETAIPPTSVEEKAIKRRFRGNAATKKTHKNLLKQQYENFAASSTKVIEQTYENLKKLISQLEMLGERNKPEIETLSLDDLFNNLKAYESEVKGTSNSTTNSHNVAFLTSSSTNNASGAVNIAQGLESIEARLLVFKKNESVYEEDIKLLIREIYLRDLDITKLKRKLELVTKEKDEIIDKCKTRLWYNVVPPPYTGNFIPPKHDLVYSSLDHFVDVNESASKSVVEKPTIETNVPKTARKEDGALIIKDWVSESEEEDVPKIKTVEMPNVVFNTARPKAVLSAVKENKGNGNPQQDLKDKRVIDSGCSRHKTRNRSCLIDYEEINGGFVAFGDFKLTNESHVLLKVPRKDSMYSVDLKNVVPQGCLTCLFAKATLDESNLWHMRLGHVNFKTMNKLVKGNIVKGLPLKLFEINQTCVACQKGKQHRASSTKDETSEILKTFITTGIENLIDLRVKVIRCDNGTEFKNRAMNQFCEITGIKREFSVARTPQQNGVAERKNKILIDAARTMLVDSKLPTTFWAEAVNTACYVQNRVLVIKPHNKTSYELFLDTLLIAKHSEKWTKLAFDIDALTKSINYKPAVAGNQSNGSTDPPFSSSSKDSPDAGFKPSREEEKKDAKDPRIESGNPTEGKDSEVSSIEEPRINQEKVDNINSTNNINTASDGNNTNNINVVSSEVNVVDLKTSIELPKDPNMPELEDIVYSDDAKDVGAEADMNNLDTFMPVSPILTTRIHKDHPVDQINGDLNSAPQTRRITKNLKEHDLFSSIQQRTTHKDFQNCLFVCFLSQEEPKKVWTLVDLPNGKRVIDTKWVYRNKKDERGIVIKNKARLVAEGYTQEEGIDYDEFFAPVARIEAIRLFLAYASFKDFVVYQMDIKSAFLYGKIEEEVYVCQPLGFEDPNFPDRVYKIEKALYDLHQAPRAWYETLSTCLLDNGFQKGKIDKTLFIRRDKGLQVKQKEDGIFISQDKYVTEILKKFGFSDVKTASTPMETHKSLLKDADGDDVDEHLYRSMIRSLMYLTSSRPNIMFAVCACARFQVYLKSSHLHAVKRIFRYLKGQPKLGLWYPKDSPFHLVAYTDSDYAGASLDRKFITGGCQFLECRLISWQYKKQTVVANSIIEAEYIAASNCCGQVLWIQNQLLDYGYNFMQTKIPIDNESTICIVKNPFFHSKTNHIEIRHHFIRYSNEKKLIQMIKIHIDQNVADLLTKAFDVSRFEYLIASIGMLNL